MLTRRCIALVFVVWMSAFAVVAGPRPVQAQAASDAQPVLMLKIRDINGMLQNWEALMPAGSGDGPSALVAMIKGMLQGTDWIDPARPLVAGMYYNGQTSSWLVFLPFQKPNPTFQGAYGAIAGGDYYLMRFPPVSEAPLTDAQRGQLLAAAAHGSKASIVVEVAAHAALQQSESQIETAIQSMAVGSAGSSGDAPLTQEETQRLVGDLIATFKQVETLRFGFNLDPQDLLLLLDVQAMPESYLAGVLTDRYAEERLDGYRPDFPLQFRSRAYNVAGAMQMLGAAFGQFYQKMGFDFDELATIGKALTGEMVGGMDLDQGQMRFEMIYALHDAVDGDDYLNHVYLPWFEKYNRRMAAMMEAQTGQAVTPLYERMPDTTIAGRKVVGVRTRFPAMNPTGAQMPAAGVLQDYQTRMTAVDKLVLMASSDKAITKMILQASAFQKSPAQGPLAEFSVDLGAYLRGLQSLMPDTAQRIAIPADMGELTMRAEMRAGTLTTRTRVGVRDLQEMINLVSSLSTGMAKASSGTAAAEEHNPATSAAPMKETSPADTGNTPGYWMDRGGLLSAYGSYKAAAGCYRKAIALAPDMAEAYFQLGVAYGEMGRYETAVTAISQAIDRSPANGAYFYGRGRVYLLAGEEELAMKDFMEAGFLGDQDARSYLKHAGVEWN